MFARPWMGNLTATPHTYVRTVGRYVHHITAPTPIFAHSYRTIKKTALETLERPRGAGAGTLLLHNLTGQDLDLAAEELPELGTDDLLRFLLGGLLVFLFLLLLLI